MITVREHLLNRHLNPDEYDVFMDDETHAAYFLLWNLSGQMIGYQMYNFMASKVQRNDEKGRYYTYVTGQKSEKHLSVWGMEKYDPKKRELFLVEGIFDAVRIHNAGHNCFAVLSNDPKSKRSWLTTMKNHDIYVIHDNDAGGNKLKKFGKKSFSTTDKNDLGDMSEEEFRTYFSGVLKEIRPETKIKTDFDRNK